MKNLLIISFLLFFSMAQSQTYAEKLGFPTGKKIIIFHVDDAGMSYESNEGTRQAIEKGVATSCSVMMPCGWSPGFMKYLKTHPNIDAGVHLTLTAEWTNYRWEPLLGKQKVPGLVDNEGAFYPSVAAVVQHATADEVEAEIKAQIARFRQFGIEPTHLDSHMGTLFVPPFLERYLKVGIEEKIPVMFPGGHATMIAQLNNFTAAQKQQSQQVGQMLWKAGLPVLDDLHPDSYGWKLPAATPTTDENLRAMKTQKYIELLQALQPGLTMVIMHCTAPSETFKYISDSAPTRKGDLLAMLDPALKQFIEKEGIIMTTWREIKERRAKIK